jgi:PGF-CTERM protein
MNRRVTALLFAVLVVASTAVAGVGAASAPGTGGAPASLAQEDEEATNNSTFDPADEVYVKENGDAVFVYTNETDGAPEQLEFGLDVSEGLMHALIVNQSNTSEFNGSFEGSAVMGPDSLTGDATLETMRPESVESLTFDLDGEQTDENAQFDLVLDTTLTSREAPAVSLVESAETSGTVTMGSSQLTSAGEAHATMSSPLGQDTLHDFSVRETDGDYTVTAEQSYIVYDYYKERWNTSERAKATLEEQYSSLALSLGGESDVTLDSYSFSESSAEGTYRLEIAYTVEYTGIDAGLERTLADSLVESEEYNLTEAEAEEIAAQVTELNIDEASARYQLEDTQFDASYSVTISNYDEAPLAFLKIANNMDLENGNASINVEELRAQLEAQQAADLTRTYEWEGSLTQPSTEETSVSFSLRYRTENWDDYVDELESRDIDPASVTYEAHAATEGDRIVADMAVEMEQEDFVKDAADQMLELTKPAEGEELTEDQRQSRQLIRAFKESDFQKARMDVSFADGQVRIEAGADFEDLAAFRDVLSATEGLPKVTQVVGRTEGDTTSAYVYARGAFAENATEDEVRQSILVDSETTVHLPGEWDRTFPEMDRTGAAEYLGVTYETATPTPEPGGASGGADGGQTDGSGPGFGAVAAVVALIAAALLVRKE